MSLNEFIRLHRREIDRRIKQVAPGLGRITDWMRQKWILSDAELVEMAREHQVKGV